MNKNNIVFLYAEITPYLLGCLTFFKNFNPEYSITIYYNSVFPNLNLNDYDFNFKSKSIFKSKNDFFDDVKKQKPIVLLVSGRMEKFYLYVSKKYKSRINVVCLFDTIYEKNFIQFLKKCFSNILYKPFFDFMWGSGSLQEKFALDIGYKAKMVKKGFYVADKIFFENSFQPTFRSTNTNFLFIGRLVKVKNIKIFAEILDEITPTPSTYESDYMDEPDVVITKDGESTIEEYRMNGRLYMIKVTPDGAPPYYLYKETLGGSWITWHDIEEPLIVPQWVAFEF